MAAVVHDFGDPFPMSNIYIHMMRHQESDIQRARTRFKEVEHPQNKMIKAAGAVEGQVLAAAPHEVTLDEFIREGRALLLRNELSITATTLLQAIKIRADVDKTTKDRRLDMIKNFFAGGNKNSENNKV